MLSLSRYAALLARADLRESILASVLGRFPIGVTGLSILMLAQASTGSFASGGALAASYIAGLACVAPILGRTIDRIGPHPILRASGLAFPAALCLLAFVVPAAHPSSPVWSFILAFAAGASFPPISVCMRTFFRQRLREDGELSTAYSLESVLIELIFIAGPMVVAVLLAFTRPETPVFVAAFCGVTGTWLFLRSPAMTGWRIEARVPAGRLGPLTAPGFAHLLVIVVGYASAFGLVEIGVAGYAARIGHPALAGLLLSLLSLGSAVGGLVYGSRTWHAPLQRQFAFALALMGIGIAVLACASNVWLFAILSFVAGLVMAPALTIQTMLVARIASDVHATEAFTWSSSGLLCGVGAGMALGGWVIERSGAEAALVLAGAAALGFGAMASRLRLRR